MVKISALNKLLPLIILTLALTTSATAQNDYYPQGDYTGGEFFQAPEYDSQRELLVQIILPFIALYALMQFVLYNTMRFTLDPEEKMGDSEIGRYSTILAIAIPAMLITTPMWQRVRLALEGAGGAIMATLVITTGYVIYKMIA